MLRVIIESPYAGDVPSNTTYAWRCIEDSVDLGEAPFASHLIYPRVLDEETERARGIQAGYAWMEVADLVAFYADLGWSKGMLAALKYCRSLGKPYKVRFILKERVTIGDIVP